MSTLFTTREAAEIVGMTFATFDYHTRRGHFRPTEVQKRGGLESWRWSFIDLVCIRVGLELRRAGVKRPAVEKALRYLRMTGIDHIDERPFIVVDGLTAWAVSEGATIVPGEGRTVQVADLRPGIREMQKAADRVLRKRQENRNKKKVASVT